MRPSRVPQVAVVAAVVIVLLGVGFAAYRVTRTSPSSKAGQVVGFGGTDSPTANLKPLPARPHVLIFGDSFTYGIGASTLTNGYAYLVAKALNWDATVAGLRGTGYLAPGQTNETYPQRAVTIHPSTPYDLIVIQGSTNDEPYSTAKLPAAIAATVAGLRQSSPHAQVLFLGPVPRVYPVSAQLNNQASAIRSWAAAHGDPYVDAIAGNWITAGNVKTVMGSTTANDHPDDSGYAYIAAKFEAAVRQLETS